MIKISLCSVNFVTLIIVFVEEFASKYHDSDIHFLAGGGASWKPSIGGNAKKNGIDCSAPRRPIDKR